VRDRQRNACAATAKAERANSISAGPRCQRTGVQPTTKGLIAIRAHRAQTAIVGRKHSSIELSGGGKFVNPLRFSGRDGRHDGRSPRYEQTRGDDTEQEVRAEDLRDVHASDLQRQDVVDGKEQRGDTTED